MYSWLEMRSAVLDEMVSLDGPGNLRLDTCGLCSNHQSDTLYRCLECSHSSLYCSECIIKLHRVLPLHRLEVIRSLSCNTITTLTLSPALEERILRQDLPPRPRAYLPSRA
jgi:hypothetical protein